MIINKDFITQLNIIRIDVDEFIKKKQEDLNNWSTLASHMSIYPVVAGHLTMLDEKFCVDYIDIIDDIVLPHNY